ncbi:4956_t:CDS:2, partial [Racocetra persica]
SSWKKQIYPDRNISTLNIPTINISSNETEECKAFDIHFLIFEIDGVFCKLDDGKIVGDFALELEAYF